MVGRPAGLAGPWRCRAGPAWRSCSAWSAAAPRRPPGWPTATPSRWPALAAAARAGARGARRARRPAAGRRRAGGRADATWCRPTSPGCGRCDGPTVRLDGRGSWCWPADRGWRGAAAGPAGRRPAAGSLPPRGGDLRAAVLSATGAPGAARPSGLGAAGRRACCGPACSGPARRCPTSPAGCCPGSWSATPAGCCRRSTEDFRATGLTHLIAVSGANVAIVRGRGAAAGAVGAGRAGAAPRWSARWRWSGFVILARPSPSVVRAAAMGAIGLLALASGRPARRVPALAAAVTVLVVLDPELAGDAGLRAVRAGHRAGCCCSRRAGATRCAGAACRPGVAEALAVPAAAQVACAPVVAGLSGSVSLVAVPANLLAVPAIAPATVLGVAAAVVSPVWPAGAEFLAWLGQLAGAVAGARRAATARGCRPARCPWPGGVAGALLLGVLTVAAAGRGAAAGRAPAGRGRRGGRRARRAAGAAARAGLAAAGLARGGVRRRAGRRGRAAGRAGARGGGRRRARSRPRSTAACAGSACGGCRCWWSATSTSTTSAGSTACSAAGRSAPWSPPAWPEPAAGRAPVARAAAAGPGRRCGRSAAGWSYAVGELRLAVLGPAAAAARHPLRSEQQLAGAARRGAGARRSCCPATRRPRSSRRCSRPPGRGALRADVLKVAAPRRPRTRIRSSSTRSIRRSRWCSVGAGQRLRPSERRRCSPGWPRERRPGAAHRCGR